MVGVSDDEGIVVVVVGDCSEYSDDPGPVVIHSFIHMDNKEGKHMEQSVDTASQNRQNRQNRAPQSI